MKRGAGSLFAAYLVLSVVGEMLIDVGEWLIAEGERCFLS